MTFTYNNYSRFSKFLISDLGIKHRKYVICPTFRIRKVWRYELSIVLSCKNVVYLCNDTEYQIKEGDIVFSNVFEFTRLMQFSTKGINLSSMFQQSNASYPIIRLPFKSMVKYYELIDVYKKKELKYSSELVQRGLVQLFLAYIYEDARPYIEVDTKNSESVQKAAEQAGFNNYSYFYKTFKSVHGISPVEYRNRTLQEDDER